MSILFGVLAIGVIMVVIGAILNEIVDERIRKQELEYFRREQYSSIKPFSVSEYLARIDKVHLDIERKKANQEDYVIILWLGLNGLRVSDCKWIKREEEKPKVRKIVGVPWGDDLIETTTLGDSTHTFYSPISYTQLMDTQSLNARDANGYFTRMQ